MVKEKCDYSVEERLALLEEAKKFFEDYSYLDERLEIKGKPVRLMADLIKGEENFEEMKDTYLREVINFVGSLKLDREYKERIDAGLGLLVGIFNGVDLVIDAFKETKAIVEKKAKLEKEQEETEKRNAEMKEKEIADITAEIKIYFNK